MRRTTCAALLVLLASGAARADEFSDAHARAVRENPTGVILWLTSQKQRYRVGERIPITLMLDDVSGVAGRSVQITSLDRRAVQWQLGGDVAFLVAPPEGWGDPLRLAVENRSAGGYLGANGVSAQVHDFRRELDLNEWVRFDRPGKYRVACRVDWVREDGKEAAATTSTILDLELVALDPAFEQETIARARSQLEIDLPERTHDDFDRVYAARGEAARALAFLATPAAVDVLLRTAKDDLEAQRRTGLLGARDGRAAAAAIEAAVTDPLIAVDHVALGAWKLLTASPRPAPLVPDGFDGEWTDEVQARFEEQGLQLADHAERERRRVDAFVGRIVAALGDKEGDAFGTTCALVAANAFDDISGKVLLDISPGLRDVIAERLVTLQPDVQLAVLRAWPALRAPTWASPLQELVGSPDEALAQVQSLALRCLHDLEPAWVEEYVLRVWPAERDHLLREPFGSTRFDLGALLLVEPGTIALDEPLLELLWSRCREHDVIERHGGAALLPRVRARASELHACSLGVLCAPLQRLWIRHDREGGLAYARAKQGTIPPDVVSGIAWGPDVEALISLPENAANDPWRTLDLLARRWGHDRLVAWWKGLAPRLREPFLWRLLAVGLGDGALSHVEAALTPAERKIFDEFRAARR